MLIFDFEHPLQIGKPPANPLPLVKSSNKKYPVLVCFVSKACEFLDFFFQIRPTIATLQDGDFIYFHVKRNWNVRS